MLMPAKKKEKARDESQGQKVTEGKKESAISSKTPQKGIIIFD